MKKNIFKDLKYLVLFLLLGWVFLITLLSLVVFIYFHTNSLKKSEHFTNYLTTNTENINPSNENIGIIMAIHNLLLYFLINPLSWLINQFIQIIIFLGTCNLLNNLIFKNNGSKFNLPPSFWIIIIIFLSLLVLAIAYKLIKIMISDHQRQLTIFRETTKSVLLLTIFLPLLPIIFLTINEILTVIIYYIMNKTHFVNISEILFNSSFTDKLNNMNHIPITTTDTTFTDQTHFSYLLCTTSYIVMLYIMFNVCKTIIVIVLELFWLFITTTAVGFSMIMKTNNPYSYMKKHILLISQHLLSYSGIFLGFNIFIASTPIIINTLEISNIKLEFSKSILILLVICIYAFFILEIPILISNILGVSGSFNPYKYTKNFFWVFRKRRKIFNKRIKKQYNLDSRSYPKSINSNKPQNYNNDYSEKLINNNINLKTKDKHNEK